MGSYFKSGAWNVICDVCGRKFKSHEVMKRWDGRMVCKDDFESRHTLDFIRTTSHEHPVPWTRPETDDTFIPINFTAYPADSVCVYDTVSVSYGIALSDAVTFTETVVLDWSAALSDAVTFTESVIVNLIQPNPLNAFAINTKTLG